MPLFSISNSPSGREKKAQKLRVRRRSSFNGPLVFFFLVIGIIFVMSVAFRVSDIQVLGNSHYTDQEIINAIDIEEGDNLFFFDRFGAISRAFAKLPYIEAVHIERSLPNRVLIEVTESKAIAFILLGDELWTMDRNCKILGKAAEGEEGTMIPVIGIDPGTLLIGEPLTTADGDESVPEHLSEILYQLQQRGMAVYAKEIDFSDPDCVELEYTDFFTVILGDKYATERKFGLLLAGLSQLTDGDAGIIDVSDGASVHFSPN